MAKTTTTMKKPEEMLAPVVALNELALAKAGVLLEMQLAYVRKYAEIGFGSLKAASTVMDPESAQTYFASQAEVARKTGETVMADIKALNQVGVDYFAEAQKIVKTGFDAMPKMAA